ncbi:DUF2272 domain-containing protein [Tardiphaga sp. 71_E8_N1_1]|uniref:DUF2272 domain-containing protein n=1 Tax=Tardiphaga sp. 71_E8_N1_1 TaxID=3240784 RepID=UPI003F8AF092
MLMHARAGLSALIPLFIFVSAADALDAITAPQFLELSRSCKSQSTAAASLKAQKIARTAADEHQAFNGNRVDHTGRMLYFGYAESESDQISAGSISSNKIPWRRVLRYWEALNEGRPTLQKANDDLAAWYYSGILSDFSDVPINRKIMDLDRALQAINGLDLSAMGEQVPEMRRVLQQSVIRSSISDVPWSAAFVSFVVKSADLASGTQFRYSAGHIDYITQAALQSASEVSGARRSSFYRACDPDNTKPRVGDLYCYHRHGEKTPDAYVVHDQTLFRSILNDILAGANRIRRSHCDIVVRVDDAAKKVTVVGGNVQNSVTEKTLNLNQAGALSTVHKDNACAGSASAGADITSNCNLNDQKWFVLLQSRF